MKFDVTFVADAVYDHGQVDCKVEVSGRSKAGQSQKLGTIHVAMVYMREIHTITSRQVALSSLTAFQRKTLLKELDTAVVDLEENDELSPELKEIMLHNTNAVRAFLAGKIADIDQEQEGRNQDDIDRALATAWDRHKQLLKSEEKDEADFRECLRTHWPLNDYTHLTAMEYQYSKE